MGGRGASSGMSANHKPYGSEYRTVYQSGNIKFVMRNEGATNTPMETMTRARIYVSVNSQNKLKPFPIMTTMESERSKSIWTTITMA